MIKKFFFSTIGGADQIIEFEADYIMLKYTFTDGRDLDTRTRIVSPVSTDYLGWARLSRFPPDPNPIILDWGGDNTGTGDITGSSAEAILVNLINYRAAYPSNPIIEIDCRCFWFGSLGVNPVVVEATLWRGGTVIKGTPSFQFSNPTATATAVLDSIGKVITLATQSSASIGDRVGVFTYNNDTNIGEFST
jgi:hypothetical protein